MEKGKLRDGCFGMLNEIVKACVMVGQSKSVMGGIEEEDVNTDYSEGDKVDADGGVSDGMFHDYERDADDNEGDEDIYEGLYELFLEPEHDGDDDVFEGLCVSSLPALEFTYLLALLNIQEIHSRGGIEEEDVNTDYSEGDKADADGGVSDGMFHDYERDADDNEGDEDIYEGLYELFLEPEHDGDDDVYEGLCDDEEEDVDTDYSEGDEIDTDDSDDGTVSDEEEDVDTDYSEGDEVDTDDSDDGTVSDVGLLVLLHLQLVAAGIIHVDERDDNAEDMYEGLSELFLEPDDDDDEGEDDDDMYEGLYELFYERDYMDEVLLRFDEIHQQSIEDQMWYIFGPLELRYEMLIERLRIRRIEYNENMIKLAFEYKRMYG
ncbi:hypothetical protein Tco_1338657 [Tanacetum coccineum]